MSKIQAAELIGNKMIFQRGKPRIIWGTGENGTSVQVQIGCDKTETVVANGCWRCELPAADTCTNLTLDITADGTPAFHFSDIAVGDVWVAGGQSNMEFFLRYDTQWKATQKQIKNPNIRMYNCTRIAFAGQQRSTPDTGYWFEEQDSAWERFSAPGYYFAHAIQPELNVPVGIIGCNWGGTSASAWLDTACMRDSPLSVYLEEYGNSIAGIDLAQNRKEALAGYAFEDSPEHNRDWAQMMYGLSFENQLRFAKEHAGEPCVPLGPYNTHKPGTLFEHMLKPITPFPVKGILWYQGESDEGHAALYDRLFTELIACWRREWQDSTLPFLFVQLAPFHHWLDCLGTNYPTVREKQELVAKAVPYTAMTSIMDLGMQDDIHPKRKKEVGERLALLARGKVYGESILCESPEFCGAERDGQTLSLTFANAGTGLHLNGNAVNGLFIWSGTSPCQIVNTQVQGHKLLLTLAEPIHSSLLLSYAETDFVGVNLFTSANLQLRPFNCLIQA